MSTSETFYGSDGRELMRCDNGEEVNIHMAEVICPVCREEQAD